MLDNDQTTDEKDKEVQGVRVSKCSHDFDDGTLACSDVERKSIMSTSTVAMSDSHKSAISADDLWFDKIVEVNERNSCHGGIQIMYGNDQFDILPKSLPILQRIDRNVNLEEITNVKFVCAGSNSHIFSATWRDQNVIVKVKSLQISNYASIVYPFSYPLDVS